MPAINIGLSSLYAPLETDCLKLQLMVFSIIHFLGGTDDTATICENGFAEKSTVQRLFEM